MQATVGIGTTDANKKGGRRAQPRRRGLHCRPSRALTGPLVSA